MMPSRKPDPVLKRCIQGDPEAFTILCTEHYDFAYRVAFRILAHEEDTEDIVQEAFIRVWQNMAGFREEIKFTTWLYSILSHLCIDKLRKQKKHADIQTEEVLKKISQSKEEEQFANEDLAAIIRLLVRELSPKQRCVFVLRDLEGLEMDEIAEITHLSSTRIKSNLWHARKAIRDKLISVYKVEY